MAKVFLNQKTVQSSSLEKTQTPEQPTGSRGAQWTSPQLRVLLQANAIHLVCSTGAIVSFYIYTVKVYTLRKAFTLSEKQTR